MTEMTTAPVVDVTALGPVACAALGWAIESGGTFDAAWASVPDPHAALLERVARVEAGELPGFPQDRVAFLAALDVAGLTAAFLAEHAPVPVTADSAIAAMEAHQAAVFAAVQTHPEGFASTPWFDRSEWTTFTSGFAAPAPVRSRPVAPTQDGPSIPV